MKLNQNYRGPAVGLLAVELPGPDRKQSPAVYCARVTYRNPRADETGCVMAWDVAGGRLPYQVALERTDDGELRWHCTCADAVYRGTDRPDHQCKHVRGIVASLPSVPTLGRGTATPRAA